MTSAAAETDQRRERLTRERILDASMKILEAEGFDALSVRRIGKELHVKDMALYHHFKSKDEILSGLVGRMFYAFAEVRSDGLGWRDYMARVMSAFRGVGIEYPNTFLLYSRRPWREAHRTGDIDALVAAGFDKIHADYVLRTLADYVTGFVVRHDIPRLTSEKLDDDDYDVEAAFGFGLGSMLDGFQHWLDRSKTETG